MKRVEEKIISETKDESSHTVTREYKYVKVGFGLLSINVFGIPGCKLNASAEQIVKLRLFDDPKGRPVFLDFNDEFFEIKPDYTAEDIINIYDIRSEIQRKASEEKEKQVEEYLSKRNTNNAGV